MTEKIRSEIQRERATEQLRQERIVFNQRMRWFVLRLFIGCLSAVLLPSIFVVACWIIWHHAIFPENVVNWAAAAVFVDVLGLFIGVWKIVLNPKPMNDLAPATDAHL